MIRQIYLAIFYRQHLPGLVSIFYFFCHSKFLHFETRFNQEKSVFFSTCF